MAKVDLGEEIKLNIAGSFTTLDEARNLACELFTCAIVAIGRTDKGIPYLRPEVSRDSTIFAYAVVVIPVDDGVTRALEEE